MSTPRRVQSAINLNNKSVPSLSLNQIEKSSSIPTTRARSNYNEIVLLDRMVNEITRYKNHKIIDSKQQKNLNKLCENLTDLLGKLTD